MPDDSTKRFQRKGPAAQGMMLTRAQYANMLINYDTSCLNSVVDCPSGTARMMETNRIRALKEITNTPTQSTNRWLPGYGVTLYRMGGQTQNQTQNLQVTLSRRARSDAMLQYTLVIDYNFHCVYFCAAAARLRRLFLVCRHESLQPARGDDRV